MAETKLNIDFSSEEFKSPFAVSKYVYTVNMGVTPFDKGYHISYNRPDLGTWTKAFGQGLIFVLDSEGNQRRFQEIPQNSPHGVVTINITPDDTDVINLVYLLAGELAYIPFVRWTRN